MSRQILVLISLLSSVVLSESARILAVFPTPSISHQVVFRPLTQELARRGHEVVILTTDPVFPKGKSPANLTEIDVHDMSYDLWRKHFLAHATGKANDLYSQMEVLFDIALKIFHMQLNTSEFKKIIDEKQHFDLLLIEAWMKPAFLLTHFFKAPVIQVSSFGRVWSNYENMGAPVHPILYPISLRQRLCNLTLWEKMTELYSHWQFVNLYDQFERSEDEFNKKTYGSDTPSIHELSNNVDMLFLNIHPIFEGNTPWPPGIISTWGIHHKPEKPLPKDLQSYLDTSKHGVIYMSFGTNVDPANLPPETIQMFIKVFSKLPYDVLWKWNQDVLPGKTEKINISKWFPQSDLLRHPKVKLFITQGGLQSTDEAIVAGVPLIGIPMLGDQWYNVEKYLYLGIGLKLDIETITEEGLIRAINEVIDNERYRQNIKKLSTLMRDEPMSGLQRAVWWTEHVLRHGGARHLRAPAANISWAQYLELELVFVLLFAILVFVVIVFSVLRVLYTLLSKFSLTVSKKKLN
nr:UDP-glucuronosyltransferase UGT33AX4 [Tuta absoluta]